MKRFRNISAITAVITTFSFFSPLTTLTMKPKVYERNNYVNASLPDGDTPLHIAARKNDTDLAKLLLDNKADIDAVNNNNETPLRIAIAGLQENIAILLLDRGASIAASDQTLSKKRLPLIHKATNHMIHCGTARAQMFSTLLEQKADINTRDAFGDTPLHDAACYAVYNTAPLSLLLESKADINTQNNDLETPLHQAAFNKNTYTVIWLINNKAALDMPNKNGSTPLDFAMQQQHTGLIKILLEEQLARAKALAHESGETEEIKEAPEEQESPTRHRKNNCCSVAHDLFTWAFSCCFKKPTTPHHKSA